MESKYYTPEIEEFHVGFEYEVYIDEKEIWSKEVFYLNNSHIDLVNHKLYNDKVRIKYLDQEDLESLGWKYNGSGWYDLIKVPGSLGYFTHVRFHFWGKETTIIAYRGEPTNDAECQHLFVGEIKNKLELRRIMKQTQIL